MRLDCARGDKEEGDVSPWHRGGETAGPSAALPRISCEAWWRRRSTWPFLKRKAHTLLWSGAAWQEIRVG